MRRILLLNRSWFQWIGVSKFIVAVPCFFLNYYSIAPMRKKSRQKAVCLLVDHLTLAWPKNVSLQEDDRDPYFNKRIVIGSSRERLKGNLYTGYYMIPEYRFIRPIIYNPRIVLEITVPI